MRKFLGILICLKKCEGKSLLFDIASVMMAHFSEEQHVFLLLILKNGVLGRSRINIVEKLGMCNDVSPFIILNDLFTNYMNWDCVGKVIDVYAKGEIVKIVKFLAQNARQPEIIVEKMRTFDCFRDIYVATFDGWNNNKVQEFIEFACQRAEIPVPDTCFCLPVWTRN